MKRIIFLCGAGVFIAWLVSEDAKQGHPRPWTAQADGRQQEDERLVMKADGDKEPKSGGGQSNSLSNTISGEKPGNKEAQGK